MSIAGRAGRGEDLTDPVNALQYFTDREAAIELFCRFVNDEPPAALVDKIAATFTRTKGDLREVVRTLVTAPEFYAPEHRGAKVKTPLLFVVSSVRATGRELRDARPMLNALMMGSAGRDASGNNQRSTSSALPALSKWLSSVLTVASSMRDVAAL